MCVCLRKAKGGIKEYSLQYSRKEETGIMKRYLHKDVWRLLQSFPCLASNKCEAQTTAEAFYVAPAHEVG